jgi:hypothetical protein
MTVEKAIKNTRPPLTHNAVSMGRRFIDWRSGIQSKSEARSEGHPPDEIVTKEEKRGSVHHKRCLKL